MDSVDLHIQMHMSISAYMHIYKHKTITIKEAIINWEYMGGVGRREGGFKLRRYNVHA